MRELELYIHIPFCVRKCEYCDFLSAPASKEQRDRYVRALLEEIRGGMPVSAPTALHEQEMEAQPVHDPMSGSSDMDTEERPETYFVACADEKEKGTLTVETAVSAGMSDYIVTSVFMGGGTPSLLETSQIAAIMETLRARFQFAENVEVTMECNPGTVMGSPPRQGSAEESALPLQAANTPHLVRDATRRGQSERPMFLRSTSVGSERVQLAHGTVLHHSRDDDAEEEKLRALRACGINRISFGLQSADNAELKQLGRIHTWEMFLESYEAARRAGFTNINVDLMSALPGQTVESWERTLQKILTLAPEHISAYSLIIEEGTPFYEKYHEDDVRREKGEPPLYLPSEEEERSMYVLTQKLLSEAGLARYEISNYARPGCECRHNIGYWRGTEYMGFGLGASSLLRYPKKNPAHEKQNCPEQMTAVRCKNPTEIKDYEQYVEARRIRIFLKETVDEEITDEGTNSVESGFEQNYTARGTYVDPDMENLSVKDEMAEFMFLGLRMMRGVSEEEFLRRFGCTIDSVYGDTVNRMISAELLQCSDAPISQRRIFLTPRGIDLSNQVMAEFII